jgi:hypothetical protein
VSLDKKNIQVLFISAPPARHISVRLSSYNFSGTAEIFVSLAPISCDFFSNAPINCSEVINHLYRKNYKHALHKLIDQFITAFLTSCFEIILGTGTRILLE